MAGLANQPSPDDTPLHEGGVRRHFCLSVPTLEAVKPSSDVWFECEASNRRAVQSTLTQPLSSMVASTVTTRIRLRAHRDARSPLMACPFAPFRHKPYH